MTSLTDILADIRKAMERATPGPWEVEEKKFRGDYSVAWKPELKVCRTYGDSLSAECDADYIAACNPSNIAAVLDALEKAEAGRDASKEAARLAWSSDEHQAVWAELKARAEAAEKERDEANRRWSEVCADFIALQKAIVGDSGLSAILRVDALKSAEAELKEAVELLKSFYTDWADENGWTDNACQNDRIVDWFGPSDFRAARRFIEAHTGGEDANK
jgi:hypothetical protein